MTVKLSHERKVRSFAKNTLGSTRVGSAMRLPVGERGEREGMVLAGGLELELELGDDGVADGEG